MGFSPEESSAGSFYPQIPVGKAASYWDRHFRHSDSHLTHAPQCCVRMGALDNGNLEQLVLGSSGFPRGPCHLDTRSIKMSENDKVAKKSGRYGRGDVRPASAKAPRPERLSGDWGESQGRLEGEPKMEFKVKVGGEVGVLSLRTASL